MKPIGLLLLSTMLNPSFYHCQNDSTSSKHENVRNALKYNLNSDGSHFFQATFSNQTWHRYNESNPGTTLFEKSAPSTFDIGLRRTRIQLFGQITDRTFIYFQFGQNNFNNTYNYTGNRKIAAFFHDAICEFKLSKRNQLKIGGGLTVTNGLSRFSQPSVSSIMTLDVPVFLQYSVDQTDQFDRRLAIYARGQVGKIDYRVYLSNPFPVNSNGTIPAPLNEKSTFVNATAFSNGNGIGINNQAGGYISYNFFENEAHTTPYMAGTYLGAKKVWNIGIGAVYQKSATWRSIIDEFGAIKDTAYSDMILLSLETFLDVPLNKNEGSAINFFAGYYNTNYGKNYLRYNGIMNPGTGSTSKSMLQSNGFGNAFPMFGTGQVIYSQFGILLPKKLLGEKNGQLLPYLSAQVADFEALENKSMILFDAGINWLIKGHNSKISLDYQSRPTYYYDQINNVKAGTRKWGVILQYQIFI